MACNSTLNRSHPCTCTHLVRLGRSFYDGLFSWFFVDFFLERQVAACKSLGDGDAQGVSMDRLRGVCLIGAAADHFGR